MDKLILQINPKKQKKIDMPGRGRGFAHLEKGRQVLVYPRYKNNNDWQNWERPFRSLIYDKKTLQPVSLGFPKFFDFDHDARATEEIKENWDNVTIKTKMDGMLVIRYVYQNKVYLRSRTSLQLEEKEDKIIKELLVDNVLLDPEFYPSSSILLELVGSQKIVLDYPSPELYLIGIVHHNKLVLGSDKELKELSLQTGIKEPESFFAKDFSSFEEFVQRLNSSFSFLEGCVLRHGQTLIKAKTNEYKLLHKRRYELHPKKIYETCQRKNPRSAEELAAYLHLPEDDYIEEWFLKYKKLEEKIEATLKELQHIIEENEDKSKKEFSKKVAQPLGLPRNVAIIELKKGNKKNKEKARELLQNKWANEIFQI